MCCFFFFFFLICVIFTHSRPGEIWIKAVGIKERIM